MLEWENGNYDELPATAAEKQIPIFSGRRLGVRRWIRLRRAAEGVIFIPPRNRGFVHIWLLDRWRLPDLPSPTMV
jgi:hypothetical protein